jgi:transmembrane sensor
VDERHWRLLVRSLSGEATPAEREELRRWTEEDPARAAEVESARALWEATGALPARASAPDADAAWRRVARRTGLDAAPATHPDVLPLRPRGARPAAPPSLLTALRRAPALRIAALLVLALGTALLWRPAGGLVNDHVLHRTITTGRGERLRVTLADGSRVLLGVESRLRVPRRFRDDARDVHLEGAAYFEVAHDPSRPFSVHTADAVTRVLGTKFTVRDYAGAGPARVAVTEGRVAVRPATAPRDAPPVAVLTRGQAVELAAGGAPTPPVVTPAVEKHDLAWTRGQLSFRDAAVPEVLAEIGRWYDVEIQVADSALAARHLTITFDDEPLDTLLREIAAALDARIERRGEVLVLTPSPAVRGPARGRAAQGGAR